MKKIFTLIGALALSGASAPARSEPLLTVRILEKWKLSQAQIRSEGETGAWTEVKLTRGLAMVNGKAKRSARFGGPKGFRLKSGPLDRRYAGFLTLSSSPENPQDSLMFLNEVPLEDYAACVTASESSHDVSEPEYLKALGSVVQLYALAHRRRHPGYDLCDLSHCQLYQGLPQGFKFWKEMTGAGKNYTADGANAKDAYYFSRCCGGLLESAKEIWGGSWNGSRTGPDEWKGQILCRDDSFFHWTSSAGVREIEETLRAMASLPKASRLQNLEIAAKTSSERNKILSAQFESPDGRSKRIRVNASRFISEFGKRNGWRVFPSARFEIKKDGEIFRFSGRGFGHGVGLCQSGALRLAQKGWTWRRILDFYFPRNAKGF